MIGTVWTIYFVDFKVEVILETRGDPESRQRPLFGWVSNVLFAFLFMIGCKYVSVGESRSECKVYI